MAEAVALPRIWTPELWTPGKGWLPKALPRFDRTAWRKAKEEAFAEAVAIDQANIGQSAVAATATTIPFTTSAAVAANGFIVVAVSWSGAVTLSSVSGGSLAWTTDVQVSAVAQNVGAALCSAQAPSGLASSTVLTATFSATTTNRAIAGTSFTGIATSSPVDAVSSNSDTANVTGWTSASVTIASGSLLIAVSNANTTFPTSTPTSPSIEAHDQGASTFAQTVCYRIEAAGGGFAVAGTWTVASHGTTVAAGYKAVAAPASPRTTPVRASFASVLGLARR